jgi:type VI secretion system protein VasD
MKSKWLLAWLAMLGACAHAAPPAEAPTKCPPQSVTVSILASPAANPTSNGEPRPVVVRIYQLKDDGRLLNASFDQMWHDDKATLGEDLVKVDELQAYPSSRTDVRFDRPEPVQHLVAVALFQEPKGHGWFSAFDLPPPPEPGKCTSQACQGDDDECATRAASAPHYAFWIDGSTVDDGIEHLDEFPQPGAMPKKEP